MRFVAPDTGRGSTRFRVEAEGADLAPFDEFSDVDFRDRRPPLTFDVDARPEPARDGRLAIKLHSTRRGAVRLQVRRASRTYVRRTVTFRRAGGRTVVLRVPRNFYRANGVATLIARSGNAIGRARIEPSY